MRRYKVSNVDFYDLTAIVKRGWILAFCKGLVERKLDITWQLPGTRSRPSTPKSRIGSSNRAAAT